jgi:acyl-CoA thioester hydrolase
VPGPISRKLDNKFHSCALLRILDLQISGLGDAAEQYFGEPARTASCRDVGQLARPRWRRSEAVLEHRRDRLPGVSGNDSEIKAPFDRYRAVVRPEWIDHNGHMNMGFYLVVFDFATDAWFRYLGLGEPHRAAQAVTTFCLEAHVTYHREVRAGDPLRFTTRLLAWDAKRLHYFHEMYHAADGFLAATNELVSLHVSEATRRAAPMAPEILDRLARIQAVHDALPRPAQMGRRMGLHAPPTTR